MLIPDSARMLPQKDRLCAQLRKALPELAEPDLERHVIVVGSFFGGYFPILNAALQRDRTGFKELCYVCMGVPFGTGPSIEQRAQASSMYSHCRAWALDPL